MNFPAPCTLFAILIFNTFWILCDSKASAMSSAEDEMRAAPQAVKARILLRDDGTKVVTTMNLEDHSLEEITYDSGEHILKRIVYRLDERNIPVAGLVYSPSGTLLHKVLLKYDSSGRVLEETTLNPAGGLVARFVYEYDASGKLSTIHKFDADGHETAFTPHPVSRSGQKRPKNSDHGDHGGATSPMHH